MKLKARAISWLAVVILVGCSGVRVSFFPGIPNPNVKTYTITTFSNEALIGPANLGVMFSEALREYFQRNTSLKVLPYNGDLTIEGRIVSYQLNPIAPGATADQGAQLQRLTITIEVNFVNIYDEKQSFEKKRFSFFRDFPRTQTVSEVEDRLLREIFDQLVLDVFNQTIATW